MYIAEGHEVTQFFTELGEHLTPYWKYRYEQDSEMGVFPPYTNEGFKEQIRHMSPDWTFELGLETSKIHFNPDDEAFLLVWREDSCRYYVESYPTWLEFFSSCVDYDDFADWYLNERE